jgi:hypothetical protein
MSYNIGGHAALVAGGYLERIARVIERERHAACDRGHAVDD